MDTTNGIGAGQESGSSSPVLTSNSQGSAESNQVPIESPKEERTFRQSEVNDLVKRVKSSAVDDYRRLVNEQPEYAQKKYGDGVRPTQPTSGVSEDHIRDITAKEVSRLRDEFTKESQRNMELQEANRIVSNFANKINTGKSKYSDFDKNTSDIDISKFPKSVQILADHIDNAADVLYDLGKDRFKMAQLEGLADRSMSDAIIQAKRLSQSLKDNEASQSMRTAREPLSQLRPSVTGMDNGASLSISELRKKYRG